MKADTTTKLNKMPKKMDASGMQQKVVENYRKLNADTKSDKSPLLI